MSAKDELLMLMVDTVRRMNLQGNFSREICAGC